jgi:serine/threonine-protein kinase
MSRSKVADELVTGARLLQRFELQRVIGEGGMGVVWAARDLSDGRAVALKFHKNEGQADERSRERFMREAEAAMSVRHPHVAQVYAVLATPAGVPFLVMDLLQGESLRQRLDRRPRLTLNQVVQVMSRVCAAVEAAHARTLIHRDLKPENIFLTPDNVLVLDFGIAKRLPKAGLGHAETALTSAGGFLGTPCYMAPEQVYGEELDERADVWSLGIVLYECLTGVLPTAGGLGQTLKVITRDGVGPILEVEPQLPASLAEMVMRMVSRAPEERPTVSEVRRVLEDAQVGRFSPSQVLSQRPLAPGTTGAAGAAGTPGANGVAAVTAVSSGGARPASRAGLWVMLGIFGAGLGGYAVLQLREPVESTQPRVKPTPTAIEVVTPLASSEFIPAKPLPALPTNTLVESEGRTWNFTAGAGDMVGLANAVDMQNAVTRYMFMVRSCMPSPESGVVWGVSGSFKWTAQGMGVSIQQRREGTDASVDKLAIESCVRLQVDGWDLPRALLTEPNGEASAHFWAGYVEQRPKDGGK